MFRPALVQVPPTGAIVKTEPATSARVQVTYRRAGDRYLLVEYGPLVLDLRLRFRVHALMSWLANVVTIAFVAFLGTIVFLVAWLVTPVLQQIAAALGSSPLQWPQLPALDEIAPRTLSDLERIFGSATPHPKPDRPKTGELIDLDSDTGHAVIATIEQLFACLNAGDRLRAYALYTNAYLASVLQPGDLPAIATPYPADDDEQTRIVTDANPLIVT